MVHSELHELVQKILQEPAAERSRSYQPPANGLLTERTLCRAAFAGMTVLLRDEPPTVLQCLVGYRNGLAVSPLPPGDPIATVLPLGSLPALQCENTAQSPVLRPLGLHRTAVESVQLPSRLSLTGCKIYRTEQSAGGV